MKSRFYAFITALAITFSLFCGVAFADGLTSDCLDSEFGGYSVDEGDYGISLLDAQSLGFSGVPSSSVASLTLSQVYPSSSRGSVTSLSDNVGYSSSDFSNPGGFYSVWSGSVTSATFTAQSGIAVSSAGSIHLSGKANYWLQFNPSSVFVQFRSAQPAAYSYKSSSSALIVLPSSVQFLFDGSVVYESPYPSSGDFTFDFIAPVSSSVSSVQIHYIFNKTVSKSSYYSVSGTSQSYAGNPYRFYAGSTASYYGCGLTAFSVQYEYEESTPDYFPILSQIYNAISSIGSQVSQQSPMDQFESDYIQNFQNQLQGTEKYLGNGSPVVPDNFVSGSPGQSSVVDSITENIGLSSGALNMTDFANASSSFSGSDSTGEGGMWQFFTQEVADDMATGSGTMTLSDFDVPSDFESELSKWIEDSERWLDKWYSP